MKVDKNGHTSIIHDDQGDIHAFVMKLTHEHKSFEGQNLVIDILSSGNIPVKDINAFLQLSKIHRGGKKSFVIVADTDFNKIPSRISVVPTIKEAHDIIGMDEIERDLGF